MKRFAFVSAFALALALAIAAGLAPVPHASAQSGATDPDAAGVGDGADEAAAMAAWIKQLDEARARLRDASDRVQELENAKGRGAARRYPRGDAKEQYLAALEAARNERNDARRAFPVVVEDARRAGVPAGVLSDYEDEADAAMAAADDDSEESDGAYEAENTDDEEYRPANTDDAEASDPADD
jgi:hypothetical protein